MLIQHDRLRLNRKKFFIILIGLIIGFFIAHDNLFAGSIVKKDGTLTSIEKDGSLIIDEQGYLVSALVKVLNQDGKHILLKNISLPEKVYFHFEYTNRGPVINFIRVYPKVIPK